MPIGNYQRVCTIPGPGIGGKVPLHCKMPRGTTECRQTLTTLPQQKWCRLQSLSLRMQISDFKCIYAFNWWICLRKDHVYLDISICFACKNGKDISLSLINNGVPDCPLHDDETSFPLETLVSPLVAEVPINERCVYDRRRNKQGTSHCLFYECPYHFKCSNTFCIPLQHICDNVTDCPEGDDESQSLCHNLTCYHMFKCVYGYHCLHPDKICDGYKDCLDDSYLGEDESVCDRGECHRSCVCYGHACEAFTTFWTRRKVTKYLIIIPWALYDRITNTRQVDTDGRIRTSIHPMAVSV